MLVLAVEDLALLPQCSVAGCFIVSTGHGGSGPFTFTGVTLADLLQTVLAGSVSYRYVDIIGADGFGTRLYPADIAGRMPGRSPLLALQVDGRPLDRAQGLVRLVAPDETDDALRQVKWVKRIDIVDAGL
jgi:DMSO/TMAO reductase YedYZ molybdopterin-dependent catalytic subunit